MLIGGHTQAGPLTLLRPILRAEAGAQGAEGATAGVAGGWGHGHHHGDRIGPSDADQEARLQGRMNRLAAMLQKLTEQNPDAQGASYAAIVTGARGGAFAVSSTPSAQGVPGDTLILQAQTIGDGTTSGGDDQVALQGTSVSGIYTGGGSDSVAIVASYVSGIHTDGVGPETGQAPDAALAPPNALPNAPLPDEIDTSGSAASPVGGASAVVAGNDALSVAAYLIRDITTGDGDDALALAGRIVANVDAGAGNDAVAIRAKVVTGITGGAGDDAIAVDAGVGVAGVGNAATWFAVAADPVTASTGSAIAQADAVAAARAYADVDGGAGNDVMSVRTASVLAVAGGAGNDTINAVGGTISLVYGAGDGKDTVNVAAGAQIVLQISPGAGPYTVEFGDDIMTVKMGEGSVTFNGIGAGTLGIKMGGAGMALVTRPGASLNQTL